MQEVESKSGNHFFIFNQQPILDMDLSNALSGLKGPGSSSEKKEAIKAQVSNEIAMQNAQTLISNATNKCYKACVTSPSTSLSSKEETCVTRCLERYFEAFNIVR